jgi:chromosome segregation ATPase
MLREDYEREKSKKKSFAASAESSTAQLESERDVAQAGVHDLRQQLSAALADIEVARSDTSRVMMGNNNLQSALEAFQSEREAELSMLEEQRLEAEQATAAAHAAALEATREANEARVREIQQAADAAVKNSMNEVEQLEAKLEKYRVENIQMRRSLDEAINRLQTTQEDVIDRTLMKNILLDWLTKASSKDKKPILEVMASVLHFTDEEKDRVNIDDSSLALRRKALMGRVAAPLPPTKADMEHLEGDNVREKWVNFLLAETDDD